MTYFIPRLRLSNHLLSTQHLQAVWSNLAEHLDSALLTLLLIGSAGEGVHRMAKCYLYAERTPPSPPAAVWLVGASTFGALFHRLPHSYTRIALTSRGPSNQASFSSASLSVPAVQVSTPHTQYSPLFATPRVNCTSRKVVGMGHRLPPCVPSVFYTVRAVSRILPTIMHAC